jgi:Protein of unknown function (DUF2971)
MILYKFVGTRDAILNIAKGSLKFTPIDELNDPSELTPTMDWGDVQSSLQILRQNGLTQEQFEWLAHQNALLDILAPEEKVINAPTTLVSANQMLRSPAYDNFNYMQQKLYATINLIRKRVGILSLTERYDSLPMWAHYANQAKGFVVCFDDFGDDFLGDATGSLNMPKRVTYSENFVGMTFDPSTQDRIFFSKLSDWSYEREWRIVSPLSACLHSEASSLFLRKVPPKSLKRVICGWRVTKGEVEALREEVFQINSDVEFVLSSFDNGRVTIGGSR